MWKKTRRKGQEWSWFNWILWGILLLSSGYLTYFLWTQSLFQIRYVQFAYGALLLFCVLSLIGNVLRKWKVVHGIFLLIAIGIVTFSAIHLRMVGSFFQRINKNATYVEDTLVVAVKKESDVKELPQLQEKPLAYGKLDEGFFKDLTEHLKKEKGVDLSGEVVTSYPDLYEKLEKEEVDAVVLNQSFFNLVEEIHPNFSENIRVLYEYKIKTEKKEEAKNPEKKDFFHLYISGIDTYGTVSTVSRSDVNIIMSVNLKTNRILLTTIPRDSYVEIAGQGEGAYDKLTHAGVFGVETSVATLEKLYGIHIDYYVRVNFTSFLTIIDLLDGIELDNPVEFTTRYGEVFPQGRIRMDSGRALRYARERYSLEGGDKDRGKNQERVIAAIIDKMSSREMLANYSDILTEVSTSVQTNMPRNKVIELVGHRLNMKENFQIESQSVEGNGKEGLPSYLMPDYSLYMMEISPESLKVAQEKMKALEDGK